MCRARGLVRQRRHRYRQIWGSREQPGADTRTTSCLGLGLGFGFGLGVCLGFGLGVGLGFGSGFGSGLGSVSFFFVLL